MVEVMLVKRAGRPGEVGLFCDAREFEEEWQSLKLGAEVKAECTVPANVKYVRFFHALCGKVAENAGDRFLDKDDAKDRILLAAHHARAIYDPLRNKTELKAKSVRGLSGDAWIRLLKRCTYVVLTEFLPGMEENALKKEIEEMLGMNVS